MPINHAIWAGIFLRDASYLDALCEFADPARQRGASTVPVLRNNSVDELSFRGGPSLRKVAPLFSEHSRPRISVWRRS